MKLSELLQDVSYLSVAADLNTEITGISYDSRVTKKGDLFVAIRGLSFDGHRFIPAALAAGAAAVLCEEAPEGEFPFIRVADTPAPPGDYRPLLDRTHQYSKFFRIFCSVYVVEKDSAFPFHNILIQNAVLVDHFRTVGKQ